MENITISELIKQRMNELKLKRREVIIRMGYKSPEKSMNKLNKMISGESNIGGDQAERLSRALELPIETILIASEATSRKMEFDKEVEREIIRDIMRQEFTPYLYAVAETHSPSSVMLTNFTHNMRIVKLDPSFLELNFTDQLIEIREKIISNFTANKGIVPAFGKITHYLFRRFFEEPKKDVLIFTVEGILYENPPEDIYRGEGRPGGLCIKGKNIDFLFQNKSKRSS